MGKPGKVNPAARVAVALPLLLGGCAALDHGLLAAGGPVAAHERHTFLIVCGILLFVAVPVLILTPLFAWYYRLSNSDRAYRPHWNFSWPLEGLVWLPPIGIVVLLAFLLWPATHKDDPYTRVTGSGPPVRIQAIGLDWKWVFVYPDEGVASVNQIAVPAGRPVDIELTSGTVMQSMLLPQLAGQIYAMPGMRTKLSFAADRPGRYLGENTQFSGTYFPNQRFAILASDDAGYRAWLARVRAGGRALDAASWAALSRRDVTANPMFFAQVDPRFFDRVVLANGGIAQPGHAKLMGGR